MRIAKQITQAAESAGTIVVFMAGSGILINVLFGASLSLIWSMVSGI